MTTNLLETNTPRNEKPDIRIGALASFIVDHIHYQPVPEASKQSQILQTLAVDFVYPGTRQTLRNRVSDLVGILPFSKHFNFADPSTDGITAPNIRGAKVAYLSQTHPSENNAWEILTANIESTNQMQNFWNEQYQGFSRDPDSPKPLSLQDGPVVDVVQLRNFMIEQKIPIEVVLARSIQLIDELGKLRDLMESDEEVPDVEAALRLADEAEEMYTPLCEAAGYDVLSAALFDKSVQVRHYLAGNHAQIRRLRKIYDMYGSGESKAEDMRRLLNIVVGHDTAPDIEIVTQGSDTYVWLTGIVDIASGTPDYQHDHEHSRQTTAKYRARFKSFGAYLEKMLPLINKHGGDSAQSMDIYGIVLIPDTDDDVPGLFREQLLILNKLADQGKLQFQAAPSRQEALHVKGTDNFIQSVTDIPSISGEYPLRGHLFDPRITSSGFHVAKATFFLDNSSIYPDPESPKRMPVELQILSQEVRGTLRTSAASHWLFKLEKLRGRKFSDEELENVVNALEDIRSHLLQTSAS